MDKARLSRLLYPDHSPFETALWISGWSFGVGYSIYSSYMASQAYKVQLARYDLEGGWFSDRLKDTSDNEWAVFSQNAYYSIPWLIIHFFGSQYLKKHNKGWIPMFYVLLSSIFLSKYLGPKPFLYLLIQPVVFFVIHLLGCSILVWICAVGFLMSGSHWITVALKANLLDGQGEHTHYLVAVTNCWINSRCVSFCLDHIWKQIPEGQTLTSKFIHLLAYCFYLPIAIGGPLINYLDFHNGITSNYTSWTWSRVRETALLLLRYAFWFLAAEIILHYFYFSALQYNPHIIEKMDLWTLCGTGYSVGQFFHIKYVFFYGLPRAFVLADAIPAPPHPKCIGRIHLYSDMWRYFDNGLYKFMHKYIYEPVAKDRNGVLVRLFSSFVCFFFIYIWHGIQPHVMIWSVLNNIGIVVENFARLINRTDTYSKLEETYLTPEGRRRFHCVLGGPLFLMSILSNFYFFMGTAVGDIFVSHSLGSWPLGTPVLLFFMYCGAQTSIEVKNWEVRKKLKDNPID